MYMAFSYGNTNIKLVSSSSLLRQLEIKNDRVQKKNILCLNFEQIRLTQIEA